MKIKVSIVDDHPMVINGIRNMLQGYDHIEVISDFNNGDDLFLGLEQQQPDVLLLDIQLPGKSGDELAPLVLKKYPDIRILVLTNFNSPLYLSTMQRQGSTGYLLKTTRQDTLIEAIEKVHRGEVYFEPTLLTRMEEESPKNDKIIYAKLALTIREKEILKLLIAGLSNKDIANKLFIGYHTVRNYRARIFDKLEVTSISELISKALALGLHE